MLGNSVFVHIPYLHDSTQCTHVMRPRNIRWQKVAAHGFMPPTDEGVADGSGVFAGNQNSHRGESPRIATLSFSSSLRATRSVFLSMTQPKNTRPSREARAGCEVQRLRGRGAGHWLEEDGGRGMSGGLAGVKGGNNGMPIRLAFRYAFLYNAPDSRNVNSKVMCNKLTNVVCRSTLLVAGPANRINGKRKHVMPVLVVNCRISTIHTPKVSWCIKPSTLNFRSNLCNYLHAGFCYQRGALA